MAIEVNDFVNSKSMLTPGVAGATVMLITNSIDMQFGCGSYLPYFVLGFSFFTGIIVFVDAKIGWLSKIVLYVLNSLIIFAMASGTNTLGTKATAEKELTPSLQRIGEAGSTNDKKNYPFTYAQQSPSTLNRQLSTRKQVLKSQIENTSSTILLVQNELVTNQGIYNNPSVKFARLKSINDDLARVNLKVNRDRTLEQESDYQNTLLSIQAELQRLQDALLQEKQNPVRTKKFFKSW